jgi:hypothetical protein
MSEIRTKLRAADLDDLLVLLRDHHARRLDVIAPVTKIRASGGMVGLAGTDPILTEDGVTPVDGLYHPTDTADGGLAAKLDIPPAYLRRLRTVHPGLWDANINGWLTHGSNAGRRFLLRNLRGDDGADGILRAFLSDSFKPIDNLDVLMAAMEGINAAGIQTDIPAGGIDLTESRMYVKVWAPQVAAMAPNLLAGYRSPFEQGEIRNGWDLDRVRQVAAREGQGYTPGQEPVVFAGFVLTNSEVGQGAFKITPQIVIRACRNGVTIPFEAMKAQHLGAKLQEGTIQWSADTVEKSLALVKAQTRDAVATFLDEGYVAAKVAELEQVAGTPVADPAQTIETVSKELRYDEDRQADILRHFIKGGQLTAGGVMQAVTSVAQTLPDADAAAGMEASGIRAMELAAA